MLLKTLREEVCQANRLLPEYGLVVLTWGNVSAIDSQSGYIVIKPSGLPFEQLTSESMVVVGLDGKVVEGDLNPSSDTLTHLELYRQFPHIKSIVHTHSRWATIWAQIGKDIPVLGTTHADDFGGPILCTRAMSEQEIRENYEENTGKVITSTLMNLDLGKQFAILARNHGPFVWNDTPRSAVEKALVLEEIAMMAWHCCSINPNVES
ncbi:MAG: L-ribulose 5-phosphate 4-epimerase, partial [Neobacillus sp.]|nr:L-ribulose 5-phosphate 4-epimerase [Neobacillus sp.]